MKKAFMYSFAFLLAISTTLLAQVNDQTAVSHLLPSIDKLVQIECSIAPISSSSERYQRHHCQEQKTEDKSKLPLELSMQPNSSINWSGYVAATNILNPSSGAVSAVAGIWLVPALSPSIQPTYSAIWVGIDGYTSSTVEQIGTGHDWVDGMQQNYAWFEMYPGAMHEIVGFPVEYNDLIGAIVQYIGNGVFQLSIYNYTRGVYTVVPTGSTIAPSAQRSSAEWIVEAPSSLQGVLPLANFGYVPMVNCFAVINGVLGPINSPNWANTPLFMAQNGYFKAIPSGLASNGSGFITFWAHQ